ncbi:MAG TPA: hypothetical protein VEW08_00070 [Steroidobacteraceae bacterium]|nr:hypothetical protein [Steroidobacteraceae bacterium]
MSVFLRWGIFGILGVAALLYAYNTSKSLAEKRSSREPPVAANAATPVEPEPVPTTAPHCQAELEVAQRALAARREGEPLDRLLRIQEIAWQEPVTRRHRLEEVATRWYQLEGEEPIAEALRIRVISDCEHFSPAP